MQINAEFLRSKLHYDPITGDFKWIERIGGKRKAGEPAGSRMSNGYSNLGFCGRRYLAHHLAWLYVYGYLPKTIDHINGDRSDNRIANLRECTRAGNAHNLSKPSHGVSSRFKGVHWAKERGRWVTQICLEGERRLVGRFKAEEVAAAAYDWQANMLFGEFAKPNGAVVVL